MKYFSLVSICLLFSALTSAADRVYGDVYESDDFDLTSLNLKLNGVNGNLNANANAHNASVCPPGYDASTYPNCQQCNFNTYSDGTTICQNCPDYVYNQPKYGSPWYRPQYTVAKGTVVVAACFTPATPKYDPLAAVGVMVAVLTLALLPVCVVLIASGPVVLSLYSLLLIVLTMPAGIVLAFNWPQTVDQLGQVTEWNQLAWQWGVAIIVVESCYPFLLVCSFLLFCCSCTSSSSSPFCASESAIVSAASFVGFARTVFLFAAFVSVQTNIGVPKQVQKVNANTGQLLGMVDVNPNLISNALFDTALAFISLNLLCYTVSGLCRARQSPSVPASAPEVDVTNTSAGAAAADSNGYPVSSSDLSAAGAGGGAAAAGTGAGAGGETTTTSDETTSTSSEGYGYGSTGTSSSSSYASDSTPSIVISSRADEQDRNAGRNANVQVIQYG